MKISVKSRYALAAVIHMAQQYGTGEHITVISISERLGISKIYLEQVFSLLRRGKLVSAVKGAQGGYQLARSPDEITVLDILSAVEFSLFEKAEKTVAHSAPEIDAVMRSYAFEALDAAVNDTLSQISLRRLADESEKYKSGQAPMFYI